MLVKGLELTVSASTSGVKGVFVYWVALGLNLMSVVIAGLSECTHVLMLEHVGVSALGSCELVVAGVVVVMVVRATPTGILSNTGSMPP